jgi:hypothetical protein
VFLPRGGNIRPTSVTTTRPRIVSATRFSHDALVIFSTILQVCTCHLKIVQFYSLT